MKKILLPVFILLFSALGYAQLNNSWIDHNKTYYTFKLAKDTLCHITQPVLAAIGLDNIPAQNFQLWRNGKEVRLYTSVSSGTLGASDYIEFWGEMNDGKPDKDLYRDPAHQLSDRYSLETDTAVYFLTVNPAGNNLRYIQGNNPVAGTTLTPDAYFMRRIEKNFKDIINRGYADVGYGEYLYSSSYDIGEGWTSAELFSNVNLTVQFDNLNKYAAGPANSVTFTIGASGNAANARNLQASFFTNSVLNTPMPQFTDQIDTVRNLPLSYLQSNSSLQVNVNGTGADLTDRIVVSCLSVTYPATFNFNNEKNFYFELAPNPAGNYLVINNFNNNGVAPVLYDMTDGLSYVGNIDVAGQVRFVLPPSALPVRRCRLVSRNAANINSIANGFTTKNFLDLSASANQGDYLIISNSTLFNNGSGVNNVDLYRQYRASATGGGFNAKIYDIDELTDQFGFGIRKHPAAIRDFIRYAVQHFNPAPKYVFIIGRGMSYDDFTKLQSDPAANKLDLVQTFGWPASDVLLACPPTTNVPLVPIGRLGAINGSEVGVYLNKVKEYEQAQQSAVQTIDAKGYMKDFLHTIGGSTEGENSIFSTYMDGFKKIAEDTLYGAYVETFAKTSSASIEQQQSSRITQLFHDGLGYIKYFGHSSSNELAINLNYPETYDNAGKYPIMHVSGCTVGNFFLYTPSRLTEYTGQSLSEKYIFLDKKGCVGFLGSTHFGVAEALNPYDGDLYYNFSNLMYGDTYGNQLKQTAADIAVNPASLSYYARINLEEMNFHGDPALKVNAFAKPDYVIEDPMVRFTPAIINVSNNNYTIDILMRNIGKAINDSIIVSVKHVLPDNSVVNFIAPKKIAAIKYADSLHLVVPINATTDKGLNKLIITLDDGNAVDELSENNNTLTKEYYIFEDELKPVSPYNYSIVNQQGITYYASTANPLGAQRQYVMELDTTELFNSPFKKTYTASGTGGIIQFTPTNVIFTDSTVYYWRTATVPAGTAGYIWNGQSFIYLANSTPGFNQSHYYQFQKNAYTNLQLGSDRVLRFTNRLINFNLRTAIYPYASQTNDFSLRNNGVIEQAGFYAPFDANVNVARFYVIDSLTDKLWYDTEDPANPGSGMYGSVLPAQINPSVLTGFYQFKIATLADRNKVMNFLDNVVSNGLYVAMTNSPAGGQSLAADWKADAAANGNGKSMYNTLLASGFTQVDQLETYLPFAFIYKKGTGSAIVQRIGATADELLDINFSIQGINLSGNIISDNFGPARSWDSLHWRGKPLETPTSDSVAVQVYGIDNTGAATLLASVAPATDTTLAWIDAKVYPYLSLKMLNVDSVKATPYQLRYWRINGTYLPEGAVAPNILFNMKDTADQGEKIDFKLAFKNISPTAFDSLMKINFIITDKSSVQHVVTLPKGKKLVSGDTLVVSYQIDTRDLPGNNTLFVDVNPGGDQPEQVHFNNILYKDFYVKADTYNPLLDVTFDGVHILNKDIVSAKPHILIDLKDESKYLTLNDTSYIKVQVRYPDGAIHSYNFGDSMIFTPANLATGNNTATIEFKPSFPQDGEYELIVSGRDVVGNTAGNLNYHVLFNVISKPMISNLLNYPNPFTTSTAFVFTVTGSEVPQNIRIQILTITGKIVREITKDELGPIHIGNNITDFKWDGTDMYGQKLANGVYLYRVLTNLNGKSLDKYTGQGGLTTGLDGTDKYFNKGYGKMVLVR